MILLGRRARPAVALWVLVSVVVWNGLYDLLLARSTQNYLFRTAIHEAGLGPAVDLSAAMEDAVRQAVWMSTVWACLLLFLGLLTIRLARRNGGAVDVYARKSARVPGRAIESRASELPSFRD
jgi:hypothetical protein